MPKRVRISINIEDCVSQNRRVVWSPAACDSLGVYMRRITYDSATVNISVFIEQRNISFQHDISLTTMRLGVLSWEQLKNRETHGRIVSFDQLREIADLFVMFIAWTSQKASKVHKLVSKLAIVLIWNIQSPHEDNRPVTPVKCSKSAHRDRGTGTIYDSCRFDLFLTLHVISKIARVTIPSALHGHVTFPIFSKTTVLTAWGLNGHECHERTFWLAGEIKWKRCEVTDY